jgi:hypothetical protein
MGNFVTMLGAVTLFNGFFMTLLGYMTEFGVTTETTAKWFEIGVTADSADTLGLQVLGVGIVIFVIGRLITRSGAKPQAA